MKKLVYFIMTLFILIIISVDSAYAASTARVIDNAGLLKQEEKTTLESTINSIKEKYKIDVVIVTTKDLEGKTPKAYADDFYNKGGYGIGDKKDGVLFLLSPETRDYYISTCGYGITAFTDYGIDYIGKNVVGMLKDNNYFGAFQGFLTDSEMFLSKAENSQPYDVSNPVVIEANVDSPVVTALAAMVMVFPISIIISLLIVFSMRRKHKTAKQEMLANNYVVDDSFNLYIEEDNFLRSSLSKTKIPKETSSSGGSSTHTSSSGQQHGGGGGKY